MPTGSQNSILKFLHSNQKQIYWLMYHTYTKPTTATNKFLADLIESNIWFTTKITDVVEKKFQSLVHHHKNVIKSAQHHRLAQGDLPHNVLDEILNHTLSVARKRNMVSFVYYASDLFQVEVSHLHPLGVQPQLAGTLRIFATANPFRFLGQCFNHPGRGTEQPVGHWTLKIFSNYLQH
jgi:hypothetical protein